MKKLGTLIVLLASLNLIGAEEHYTNNLTCTDLFVGQKMIISDPYFSKTGTTWEDSITYQKVSNNLILQFDPFTTEYLNDGWVEFDLGIKYFDENQDSTTTTQKFRIDYSNASGTTHMPLNLFEFSGGHWVEITINGISKSGSYTTIPCGIILSSGIKVERYYSFKHTKTANPTHVEIGSNRLQFNWPHVNGAEAYDLEWLYVDDYDTSGTLAASEIQYDFRRSAVRVQVKGNAYDIPIVYEQGYLLYRVRPVGVQGSDKSIKQWGSWSGVTKGLVSSFSDKYTLSDSHVNEKVNWRYNAAFGEDGLQKNGVTYFDGTSRSRQSVVRNNETSQTLVQEIYYDQHGRASVFSLPSPSFEDTLKYYAKFNQADGNPYDYKYFANNGVLDSCNLILTPFDTTSGAGKYYSSNNPDQLKKQAFVPEAYGYAFRQVQYTPDMMSRVQKAGKYGETHQIGSGQNVEIEYSTPTQKDLNRLFGTEVGWEDYYRIITRKDENGQYYREYLDMFERVVATSLVGQHPSSLDKLNSNTGAKRDTTAIKTGVTFITSEQDGNLYVGLNRIKEISTKGEGYHTFYIEKTLNNYTDTCLPTNFCLDCIYDLNVKIIDNCGVDLANGYSQTIGNWPLDTLCGTDTLFTDSLRVNLGMGKYYIEETITVNDSSFEFYYNQYLEENTCIPTYQDILTSLLDSANTEMCNPFIDSTVGNTCRDHYLMMLSDFYPGGQYSLYFNQDSAMLDSTFNLSIFNPNNKLPGTPFWRDVTFLDDNGNPDSIFVLGTKWAVDKAPLFNVIGQWNPSWSEQLVQYHPEYCYYNGCMEDSLSHKFDALMRKVDNFNDAFDSGYFNLVNMAVNNLVTEDHKVPTFCTSTAIIDPLFKSGASGSSYLTDFRDSLTNFMSLGGSNFTIWQIASINTRCGFLEDNATTMDSCLSSITQFNLDYQKSGAFCQLDELWENYKTLYLASKQRIYDKIITSYAITNDCYNGCIGTISFDNTLNNFSGSGAATDPNQPCNNTNYTYYQSKLPRWATQSIPLDDILGQSVDSYFADARDTSIARCKQNCDVKADGWMDLLKSGCVSLGLDSANIRNGLIEVCELGCDSGYYYGASTTPTGLVTASGFRSFMHVLDSFEITIDSTCNPYLFSGALPFEYDTNSETDLDTCACDAILQYNLDFQNATNLPANITSLEDYFLFVHGEAYPGVESAVCHCNQVYSDANSGSSWSSGSIWGSNAPGILTSYPKPTLESLTCAGCVDCAYYDSLRTVFENQISIDTTNNRYFELFAAFANQTIGFNLSPSDYRDFHVDCNNNFKSCRNLTLAAQDLYNVLNEIAQNGQLTPNTDVYLNLTSLNSYNLSALATNFAGSQFFTCGTGTSPQTCNDSTQYWRFGKNDDYCEFKAELNASRKFSDITGFLAMLPTGTTCGSNYNFNLIASFVGGFIDTVKVTTSSNCIIIKDCCLNSTLCNKPTDDFVEKDSPCEDQILKLAQFEAEYLYNQLIDSVKQAFTYNFYNKCFQGLADDNLSMAYWDHEYHYTLYYYDRAGNLVKTVHPKGVDANFNEANVNNNRVTQTEDEPNHAMVTRYNYNAVNNLIAMQSPDEGTTLYWYDASLRLVASQNSKQKANKRYSYSIYDENSRTIEFGEIEYLTDTLTDSLAQESSWFANWLNSGTKYEITKSFYDEGLTTHINNQFSGGQTNLRLNIATVAYYENEQAYDTNYTRAVHYSYDPLGNVKTLIHDYPELNIFGYRFFKTTYQYEYLTGNINKVLYNADRSDQFYHEYVYDADNRLIEVKTSENDKIWQTEARYFYYDHGPLARVELGDQQVQGVDFMYTINGWLKGMNSVSLSAQRDPGFDGYKDAKHYKGRNQNFAPDVVGWSLNFHENDYTTVATFNTADYFEPEATGAFESSTNNFYDGNIAAKGLGIKGFEHLGYAYRYDQLKRLTERLTFNQLDSNFNQWKATTDTSNYYVKIGYDANGNIDSLARNAYIGGQLAMDNMQYNYNTGKNQLNFVEDAAADFSSYDDIKQGQSADNYEYNVIGQLVADASENIDTIYWDAYHRIKRIAYNFVEGEGKKIALFEYDANGHRMKKTVQTGMEETLLKETTYYVNDVSGNTQSFYSLFDGNTTCSCTDGESFDTTCYKFRFSQDEIPIYGLGREGTYQINRVLRDSSVSDICGYEGGKVLVYNLGDSLNLVLGKKHFELKDHTGNIHATITDRKLQLEGVGGNHAGYVADVAFKADYYPFGMIEPGRNTNPTESRFAFQSMESEAAIAGTGNSYTTYYRQYDPRLGRWKTPDPVIQPHESPYASFANNPVLYTDPEGNIPPLLCAIGYGIKVAATAVGQATVAAAPAVGSALATAAPYVAVGAAVSATASTASHMNTVNSTSTPNPIFTEPHSPRLSGDGIQYRQLNRQTDIWELAGNENVAQDWKKKGYDIYWDYTPNMHPSRQGQPRVNTGQGVQKRYYRLKGNIDLKESFYSNKTKINGNVYDYKVEDGDKVLFEFHDLGIKNDIKIEFLDKNGTTISFKTYRTNHDGYVGDDMIINFKTKGVKITVDGPHKHLGDDNWDFYFFIY